ncbi:MAG: succinate dehydrogenase assembly factor 2 [Gammaproteobacteria bacterium]|nr:succinate dehydrogenase assembly factor 2 [Gammaproteobacteria bacterium]
MAELKQNRLRWRCRRGMRELDIVLSCFLDRDFETLSSAQRVHFSSLLETPDPELYAWLLRREVPAQPEFQILIAMLQSQLVVP